MTWRKLFSLVLAAVLSLVLIPSLITADPPPKPPSLEKIPLALRVKIEPQVLKELTSGEKATYIVYLTQQANLAPARQIEEKLTHRQAVVSSLRAVAERSQQGIRTYLDGQRVSGHVEEYTPFWVFNGLAVTGDLEALLSLAARPEVERIRANHTHQLPDPHPLLSPPWGGEGGGVEWNITQIRADQVWTDLGITGRGVVVANMDTGVDWTHPALQSQYRGADGNHEYNWYDATGTYPNAPDDGHGHGTHTMGTIVGDDGGANQIGVAPGARWIAVKIFDDYGSTDDVQIHQGFQWILAPTDLDGENPDASKAPDVVNNSWGTDPPNVADSTHLADVQALRAAGILPVFAAGNEGEWGEGSVGAPGGYPESFAVGATDSEDAIASFSSRGPSFWEEIKPEVSAPGVDIRSSVPGGGYEGGWEGTSMATPHAVGLTALLLEADPTLTLDALEDFMKYSALDLGQPGPDNTFGAGRIDAYDAVRWALGAGKLYGQVRDAETGDPIPEATIRGESQNASRDTFMTTTDATGIYVVSVPEGLYDVTAIAFGYPSATVQDVEVVTGYMSMRDLALKPAPTGTLSGQVTEGGADKPLAATIRVFDSPLRHAQDAAASATADAGGFYSLALPVGSYTVEASMRGHQIQRAAVDIAEEEVTNLDFSLPTAPALLLVDADVGMGDSVALYYQHALDKAGYLYDTRPITDTTLVPTAEELEAYDVVLWANPWGSPGYIGADEALMDYLDHGGQLLISGQDIGYWDYSQDYAPSFYTEYLHASFLGEPATLDELIGTDILEGLNLTLNDTYAYKNTGYCIQFSCFYPDEIEPADDAAWPIIAYPEEGIRGLKAESSPPSTSSEHHYRVIYFGFGLESVGSRDALAQTMDRAITWLTLPSLTKTVDKEMVTPGGVLTYTLTLKNIGATDLADVSLTDPMPEHTTYVPGSAIGATYDPVLDRIEWNGTLSAATHITFTFQVAVEDPLVGGTVITNTATLDDGQGGILQASATTTVLAPNLTETTKTVDKAVAAAGDVLTYTISLVNSGAIEVGDVSLVDPIPQNTVYVSGSVSGGATYNPALDQIEWAGAVPVLASGYTWTDSDQPGGPIYEWVDITDIGTPIDVGDDTNDGPFPIGFSFPFYDNVFTTFRLCSNGFLSLTSDYTNFTNVSLPSGQQPFNLIAPFWDDLTLVTSGEAYYWSDNQDTLVVSYVGVPHYASGGPYTFQVILRADGSITYQYQSMVARLEEATIGIQNADGTQGLTIAYNEAYMHDELAVLISPPSPPPVITFQVQIADPLPTEMLITNTAVIDDGQGTTYERQATTWVNTIELEGSTNEVDKSVAIPGEVLTYTVTLRNSGIADAASVTVIDPIPAHTVYLPGSATGEATYDEANHRILWSGAVSSGDQASFSFAVRAKAPLLDGTVIVNTATIDNGAHLPFTRTATTTIAAPDLSPSEKRVSSPPFLPSNPSTGLRAGLGGERGGAVSAGQVLTYTILVKNGGSGLATVALTDTLPTGVVYVPGSAWAGSGGPAIYDALTHRLTWSGPVPVSGMATVRFAVQALGLGPITNRVLLDDGAGNVIEKHVTAGGGEHRIFLPVIMKAY